MVTDIERALEDVVTTARAHLAAVRAFGVDADTTLAAYDACADAATAYERLLNEQFDESVPWSPELDDDETTPVTALDDGDNDAMSDEPWLAVRVRADYFVEDEDALFAAADDAAHAAGLDEWTPVQDASTAVSVLLAAADTMIAPLDTPGLQRGNGTATVHWTNHPLADEDLAASADEQAPFVMARDQLVAVVPDLVPDLDDDLGDDIDVDSPGRSPVASVPADATPSGLGSALGRERN